MSERDSLVDDLAHLAMALVAVGVYLALAVMDVPFVAFVWLLCIPGYITWRFLWRSLSRDEAVA